MNREELVQLRDAIGVMLAWTDAVRDQVARWLAPEAAKPGNGLDLRPPPVAQTAEVPKRSINSLARSPTPHAGKARPGAPPTSAKAAEQRLLAAMREHSGETVIALAKAAGANRSSTGERLRGLARAGKVTKDSAGRWRLATDLAGEEARPTQPLSN
jgi:hypothetical protein